MVKRSDNPAACTELAVEDLRDGNACTFPNPDDGKNRDIICRAFDDRTACRFPDFCVTTKQVNWLMENAPLS